MFCLHCNHKAEPSLASRIVLLILKYPWHKSMAENEKFILKNFLILYICLTQTSLIVFAYAT